MQTSAMLSRFSSFYLCHIFETLYYVLSAYKACNNACNPCCCAAACCTGKLRPWANPSEPCQKMINYLGSLNNMILMYWSLCSSATSAQDSHLYILSSLRKNSRTHKPKCISSHELHYNMPKIPNILLGTITAPNMTKTWTRCSNKAKSQPLLKNTW